MARVPARVAARIPPAALLAALVVTGGLSAGCKPGAEDFCERFAKAQCRFQYSCCNASERQSVGLGFGQLHHNEETCVEELTKAACAGLAVYADSERAGRSTWEYEASNACLAVIETGANECDASVMLGPAPADECQTADIATGTVADGDECFESFECANDEATCVPNEPEDEEEQLITEKGTCTPPPGVGDECPDYFCSEAAWCDTSEDPRVCKAKKPNGEACDGGNECDSGVCSYTTGDGICGPKKPNGEPCDDHDECASEFCDDDTATCEDKRAAGEPCFEDEACQSGTCDFDTLECVVPEEDEVDYQICLAEEQ